MLARPERLRLVVAGHRGLAAQHHDPHVEVVRVQLLGEVGLLAAMHDLETLAAQVALERLAGEGAFAAAARQQGNAFRTARKVVGVLSRVTVMAPPRTRTLASKSWQWLGTAWFGFTLVFTTRYPSRRRSASNARRSILVLRCVRCRPAPDGSGPG